MIKMLTSMRKVKTNKIYQEINSKSSRKSIISYAVYVSTFFLKERYYKYLQINQNNALNIATLDEGNVYPSHIMYCSPNNS